MGTRNRFRTAPAVLLAVACGLPSAGPVSKPVGKPADGAGSVKPPARPGR